MKKLILIVLCVVVTLAGCVQKAVTLSSSPTPADSAEQTAVSILTPMASVATATPIATPTSTPVVTPSPTPQPEPVNYAIDGKTIVRAQGAKQTVIYDVTEQYPGDWDCWLNNLTVEPEALYFTEGGIPRESDGRDEDTEHALIRLGFDGSGRTVLEDHGFVGYLNIVPYGDRIFFREDGFDSAVIGWAWRDGSGSDWLDITDYAAHYDMPPWYDCSALYLKGGMLYADIILYGDYDQAELAHTIRIGTGLLIQHVSG